MNGFTDVRANEMLEIEGGHWVGDIAKVEAVTVEMAVEALKSVGNFVVEQLTKLSAYVGMEHFELYGYP